MGKSKRFALQRFNGSVGLITVACDSFSFVFVIFIEQGILFYEIDKRKADENRKVLAYKLEAGKRTRSHVLGYVYYCDADVCVVGYRRLLIPKSKRRSEIDTKQLGEGGNNRLALLAGSLRDSLSQMI